MKHLEPHTGRCEACGALIIDAYLGGGQRLEHEIRLDATPDPRAPQYAWNRGDVWIARPARDGDPFLGMRRPVHTCPDYQLDLSAEGASAPVSLKTTEEPMCRSDASTPDAPS